MKTLIYDVKIIDGTGDPIYKGSVLFDSKEILQVVKGTGENFKLIASTTIDGKGKYLAPGFIDLHSHSDLAAISPSILRPKIAQGITTEVCGVCGLGVAPISQALQASFRQQSIIGKGDRSWPWESFSQFKQQLELNHLGQSIFPFVGHGVLRYAIAQNRPEKLSDQEIENMRHLLQQCFDQGAMGLSLGLIYLPALYADERELRAVIEVAAQNDKMVMVHLRSESDGIVEAIHEVAQICQQTGAKLHLSHLKIIGQKNEHKIDEVFRLLEQYDLSFDHYPYCYGSTTLFSLIPPWMMVGDSPAVIIKNLRSKISELRVVYRGDHQVVDMNKWGWDNLPYLCGWENIVISGFGDSRQTDNIGKSLSQLATEWQVDEVEALLEILAQADGQVMMIDTYMREELLQKIMQHPRGLFATDSLFNANPHPRISEAYPKILREYVGQKKWLSLEEAVSKMTGRSAKLMGWKDRGLIQIGKRPDLVLFGKNFENIATYIDGMRLI